MSRAEYINSNCLQQLAAFWLNMGLFNYSSSLSFSLNKTLVLEVKTQLTNVG
jgi:hypothetical protein